MTVYSRGMTKAPNFTGSYPGAGKMIGPAWQAAWDLLQNSGDLIDKRSIVPKMVAAGGVSPVTAGNLLRDAAKAGKIKVDYVRDGHVLRAYYGRAGN